MSEFLTHLQLEENAGSACFISYASIQGGHEALVSEAPTCPICRAVEGPRKTLRKYRDSTNRIVDMLHGAGILADKKWQSAMVLDEFLPGIEGAIAGLVAERGDCK